MAATIQVTAIYGVLKKIEAQYLKIRDGFGGAWNNSNAESVSVNDYLDIPNGDCLIMDAGVSVELKFTPDAGTSDGQGFGKWGAKAPFTMEVTEVSGIVYVTRARYIGLKDDREDIFANTNRVAATAGLCIEDGDYILSDNTGAYFKVKLLMGASPSVLPPFETPYEMPGIEEGLNFSNAF